MKVSDESWLKIKHIYIITSGARAELVSHEKGKERKRKEEKEKVDINAYISGADSSTRFVDNTFA